MLGPNKRRLGMFQAGVCDPNTILEPSMMV